MKGRGWDKEERITSRRENMEKFSIITVLGLHGPVLNEMVADVVLENPRRRE